jgi:predicted Zn-ribbon and HTH transcriptional regulator
MKSIACSRCGEAFVAERTEAGALQSRFCPDCLEEKLLEKNFPSQEVRQSWFQLFALDPPPSFFERQIDLDEWRTCSVCGRRFKTHPDVVSELCPPCLEENLESAPFDKYYETPISPSHAKIFSLFYKKKGEKAFK